MADNGVRLDEDGFIDSSQFQKEVQSALDSDVKYRQVDYMKKRAVKVAKSYDEFKDMVACAHLKTLSRNEVEELSTKKKGWKKAHVGAAATSLLSDDYKGSVFHTIPTSATGKANSNGGSSSGGASIPRTMMEFGRDWRRLSSSAEKEALLMHIGRPKLKKIVAHGDDFDVLEDVCRVIVTASAATATDAGAGDATVESSSPSCVGSERRQWLSTLSTMQQFDMLMGCVPKELAEKVRSGIESGGAGAAVGEGGKKKKTGKVKKASTEAAAAALPTQEELDEAASLAKRVQEMAVATRTGSVEAAAAAAAERAKAAAKSAYVPDLEDLD